MQIGRAVLLYLNEGYCRFWRRNILDLYKNFFPALSIESLKKLLTKHFYYWVIEL